MLAEAERRGWTISAIWNTHWHPDHTGGNQAIKDACGAPVIAPAAEAAKIPTADRLVAEGDTVTAGQACRNRAGDARAYRRPHHLSLRRRRSAVSRRYACSRWAAGGCSKERRTQMHANLQRLAKLPPETQVYCAHEYTLSNARYAHVAEPANDDIASATGRGRTDARPRRADRPDHDRRGARDQSVHARGVGRTICRTARGEGCFLNTRCVRSGLTGG